MITLLILNVKDISDNTWLFLLFNSQEKTSEGKFKVKEKDEVI